MPHMPDDPIDRQLLDIVQVDFPLSERPFHDLGRRVGIDEDEALQRIARLKADNGPIRQISAIFDSHTLGYDSTLAASRVAPDRVEAAANVLCEHPGVSHCYERDHAYNLWYTLAVTPASKLGLDRTLEILHQESGAESTRKLPTLRLFKIGVVLDLVGRGEPTATSEGDPNRYTAEDRRIAKQHVISDDDLPIIRALQTDIVIEPRPFDRLAQQAGCTAEQLIESGRRLIERRQMRRYAAVLRHRQAGYRANCMVCWQVPDDAVETVGTKMAGFDAVSHCYQRPAYDDWPYNVYTMIHGQSRDDCLTIVQALAEATNIADPAILWSTREFKKTRVRYFTGETEAWERRHGP